MFRGNEAAEYLSSLSFTDPSCFVQELQPRDLEFSANSRALLFQIVPKLSYNNVRELKRLEMGAGSTVRRANTALVAFTPPEKEEFEKLVNLSHSVDAEDKSNDRTLLLKSGELLRYGEEVQLRHVASHYYLQYAAEPAEQDQTCSKAYLSPEGSASVYFRVDSRFKLKQWGDPVVYDDHILLKNVKSGLYLHISEKRLDPVADSAPSVTERSGGLDFLPHPSVLTATYDVNLSSLKTVWQPQLYTKGPFHEEVIFHGEVIKLRHTERNGLVASDAKDYSSDGLPDLFILQQEKGDLVCSSAALFILEEKGGKFRLRHLQSNRVVTVVREGERTVLSLGRHTHEAGFVEGSQAEFAFMSTSGRILPVLYHNSIVKVMHSGTFLSSLKEEWSPQAEHPSETPFFEPLQFDQVFSSKFILTTSKENKDEDAFEAVRADIEEVQEVDFLRSSQNVLYRYGTMLQRGQEVELPMHATLERVLTELIFFCVEADSENPFVCEGEPKPRRQLLMRGLGIIDLVARVLTYAFDTGVYVLESMTQSDPVVRVCSLCYRLMKHASTNLRSNERYCAQWMPLFLTHVKLTNEVNSIKAEETLAEILSDNTKLLEEVVTPHMIEMLVDVLTTRQRDAKYMKLLTVLCTSQGIPIRSNQIALSGVLLKNERVRKEVFMEMKQTGSVTEVEVREYSRWLPVSNLQSVSRQEDNNRIYRYFVGLIEMVAELAAGRNRQAE